MVSLWKKNRISDYGSIESNQLSPAAGAWYGDYSMDFVQGNCAW